MSKLKRPICIISTIAIIFLLFVTLPVPAVSAADEPKWPLEGSIFLDKTATPLEDDEYSFEITLDLYGKNKYSRASVDAASVVLVFDQSGSMAGVKLEKAKAAAINLLDVLQPNSTSRISVALVAYGTNVTKTTEFSDFSKKDELKSTINNLSTTGTTGTQVAIKKARDMLNTRSGVKYMIVLSDGEPNVAYASTAQTEYDKLIKVSGSSYNFNFLYTAFNYATTSSVSESDGTIRAISEAYLAKQENIEIFSVALGTSTVGANQKYGMLNIAQDEAHYMEAASADKLKEVFAKIAEEISYAAEDGVVVDELAFIPGYPDIAFEYNPALGAVTVSQGTVTFNETTNTFTWEVGTLVEKEPNKPSATMKYYVTTSDKLRSLIEDLTINPETTTFATNEKAIFNYTNVNGESASKLFPVPEVALPNTHGLMYARFVEVDKDGKLIGSDGCPLDEQEMPQLANSVRSQIQIKNNVNDTWLFRIGETYDIALPADNGITGYELYGSSSKSVKVENSQTYVYFTYVKTEPNKLTVNITFEIDVEGADFAESATAERSETALQSTAIALAKPAKVRSRTYNYGDKIVVPVVVCESGYKFLGWTPTVAETATANVTYEAIIEKVQVTDKPDGPGTPTTPSTPSPPSTPGTTTPSTPSTPSKPSTPKTGDEASIILPVIGILCASIVAAVALKKKKHENV